MDLTGHDLLSVSPARSQRKILKIFLKIIMIPIYKPKKMCYTHLVNKNDS